MSLSYHPIRLLDIFIHDGNSDLENNIPMLVSFVDDPVVVVVLRHPGDNICK